MTNNPWNIFYEDFPLEKIPWQKTQADWFKELVDDGTIRGDDALDLGCGTGIKSIYLAKKGGFENVVGIDISPKAIEYARKNAENEGVKDQTNFKVGDITKLDKLVERKFDFILDWAALHGLPKEDWDKYIEQVANHTKNDGKLLLRVFSDPAGERKYFVEDIAEGMRIYLFDDEMIEKLYGKHFEIIKKNKSKPKTKKDFIFREYLMKKR